MLRAATKRDSTSSPTHSPCESQQMQLLAARERPNLRTAVRRNARRGSFFSMCSIWRCFEALKSTMLGRSSSTSASGGTAELEPDKETWRDPQTKLFI